MSNLAESLTLQKQIDSIIQGFQLFIQVFLPYFGMLAVIWVAKLLWRRYQQKQSKMLAANWKFSDIDQMDGLAFEKFCGVLLKNLGCSQIRLTPTVGDYGIDVLAVTKSGRNIGLQCKRYRNQVGIRAIQEAYSGKAFYRLEEVYVVTNSHFTVAARKMALRNGVQLVDREKLLKWLKTAQRNAAKETGK